MDILFTSGKSSGVFSNSGKSLIDSGLTNCHESVERSKLIGFVSVTVSKRLMNFSKDILEHSKYSSNITLVGEVLSKLDHNVYHFSPFRSVGKMFLKFFQMALSFSNLNKTRRVFKFTDKVNTF